MPRSACGRYLPLAVETAGEPAGDPLSFGGPLARSKRLQQTFRLEGVGTLARAVTNCCFLPKLQHNRSAAAGRRAAEEGETPEAQKFFSAKSPVTALAVKSNGMLCSVTEESGTASVVAVQSRDTLRRFQGQPSSKAPPLRCCCFEEDRNHLVTGGDDCVVRQWNLETGALAVDLKGHTDSVRCISSSCGFGGVLLSAAYDATAKLWDVRTRNACLTITQGSPTEAARLLDVSSTLQILTAAGTQVRLWDVRQAETPLWELSSFAKTVIALKEIPVGTGASNAGAARDGSSSLLLATASLDNVVRIFSLDTLQLQQCFGLRSDVLCMDAVAGDLKPSDAGYFKRGRSAPANAGDMVVDSLQSRRLSRLDQLVKTFQYQAAMDVALTTTPQHVLALSAELLQRGGLRSSVRGRDMSSLLPLLRFISKHIGLKGAAQTAISLQLLHSLLDENEGWLVEEPQAAPELKTLLAKICQRVAFELEQIRRFARVEALVDALLAIEA
ncbi:wd g-beta repeat-containing protein [Cyclospora cayetanensis]|uniref:Wd g-beta repeat-containing protein n=1 Tax=Cyclospora cayetanensis TaxID=88456 RepID=A0A1D3D6R5_9EIME|nr:wd g-beta repeat-containing protein [Cyclospora cayetanensis]